MLLACNVVALVFAFFNPPVSVAVLFLYWAESVVIGMLNVVKLYYLPQMAMGASEYAALSPGLKLAAKSVGPGAFFLGYGFLVFVVFGMLVQLGEHEMKGRGERGYDVAGHLAGFWFPVLLVAAGHVVSFFRNFLGKREYIGRSWEDQMQRPFKRVIVMFLVMFGACGVIIAVGLPEIGLVLFVPFMLIASLEAHFRERAA
jgi:hypothetical protein